MLGAFLAIAGVEPQWTWLLVPIPLLFLMLFAVGVSLMLSSLFVSFRDVRPIWEVILQALFYATPVIYPIEVLADKNETLSHVALMNPVATVIQETRHLVLDDDTPSAADAIGDPALLLVPLFIVVAATGGGLRHLRPARTARRGTPLDGSAPRPRPSRAGGRTATASRPVRP